MMRNRAARLVVGRPRVPTLRLRISRLPWGRPRPLGTPAPIIPSARGARGDGARPSGVAMPQGGTGDVAPNRPSGRPRVGDLAPNHRSDAQASRKWTASGPAAG